MIVYRLASARYPSNDGAGAKRYGGRWNHKGTPVIYAAASRALCALEILANADELATDYVVTPIEVPLDLIVTEFSIEELPPNWDAGQPTEATADIGTKWANGLTSVMLVVPSAVIPRERSYIMNPRHPDFAKLVFLDPEPLYFDDRLGRAWRKDE